MTTLDIPLSDPDISTGELEAVEAVLRSTRISAGEQVEAISAAVEAVTDPELRSAFADLLAKHISGKP